MKSLYIGDILGLALKLRNAKLTAIAFLASLATSAYAGVFGFEDVSETHAQTGDFWTSQSGAVSTSASGYSASLNYLFYYTSEYDSYSAGGAVSSSKTTLTDYSHDMDSQAGGAASGNKYGVMYMSVANSSGVAQYLYEYGSSTGYPGLTYSTFVNGKNNNFDKVNEDSSAFLPYTSFLMDNGAMVNFTSIDLSLTAMTFEKLDSTGASDSYMGKNTIHTKTDGIFAIRIYGILDADAGTLTDNYVDWIAAKYVDGTNDILLEGWNSVSLANLQVEGGLSGLAFQAISNFGNAYGMGVPTYLAFDNISFNAVPEPSTYAAIFGILAMAIVVRRRK